MTDEFKTALLIYLGYLIFFLFVALLSGCAIKPLPIIYQCPQIDLPPIPETHVAKLNSKSKPNEVAQAFTTDLIDFKGCCIVAHDQVERSQGQINAAKN